MRIHNNEAIAVPKNDDAFDELCKALTIQTGINGCFC
jgi:hypothetical protein